DVNEDRQIKPSRRLKEVCQDFFKKLLHFSKNLSTWTYWRRAWTIQEWSLARDITIALEGLPSVSVAEVKSSIFAAALLVAEYKLEQGQYAHIDPGFSRGEAAMRFDSVKRMFPYEDTLLSFDEVDERRRRFQSFFPHYTTETVLGGHTLDARTISRRTDDV